MNLPSLLTRLLGRCQETAAMADLRYENGRLQRLVEERDGQIKNLGNTIAGFKEYDIPKLERERNVLIEQVKFLTALHEKELTRLKADIAVHNEAIEANNRPAALART